MKLLLKHFEEIGKEKFSNFKQLEKWQNKYYSDIPNLIRFCSLTSLQPLILLISLLKRNLSLHWKWKIFAVTIHDLKKIEIDFSCNTFFLYLLTRRFFFSRIYTDGIKNIFNNVLRVFQMARIKQLSQLLNKPLLHADK